MGKFDFIPLDDQEKEATLDDAIEVLLGLSDENYDRFLKAMKIRRQAEKEMNKVEVMTDDQLEDAIEDLEKESNKKKK